MTYKKLKQLRRTLGKTQSDIAKEFGVNQSFISKLENNEMNINVDLLKKILPLYGTSIEKYFNDKESRYLTINDVEYDIVDYHEVDDSDYLTVLYKKRK